MIGPDVTITIVAVKGGMVRVGIDAPKDVAVDREEVAARRGLVQPAQSRTDVE